MTDKGLVPDLLHVIAHFHRRPNSVSVDGKIIIFSRYFSERGGNLSSTAGRNDKTATLKLQKTWNVCFCCMKGSTAATIVTESKTKWSNLSYQSRAVVQSARVLCLPEILGRQGWSLWLSMRGGKRSKSNSLQSFSVRVGALGQFLYFLKSGLSSVRSQIHSKSTTKTIVCPEQTAVNFVSQKRIEVISTTD